MTDTPKKIAIIAYEANRAWRACHGRNGVVPPWEGALEWERIRYIEAVCTELLGEGQDYFDHPDQVALFKAIVAVWRDREF